MDGITKSSLISTILAMPSVRLVERVYQFVKNATRAATHMLMRKSNGGDIYIKQYTRTELKGER